MLPKCCYHWSVKLKAPHKDTHPDTLCPLYVNQPCFLALTSQSDLIWIWLRISLLQGAQFDFIRSPKQTSKSVQKSLIYNLASVANRQTGCLLLPEAYVMTVPRFTYWGHNRTHINATVTQQATYISISNKQYIPNYTCPGKFLIDSIHSPGNSIPMGYHKIRASWKRNVF